MFRSKKILSATQCNEEALSLFKAKPVRKRIAGGIEPPVIRDAINLLRDGISRNYNSAALASVLHYNLGVLLYHLNMYRSGQMMFSISLLTAKAHCTRTEDYQLQLYFYAFFNHIGKNFDTWLESDYPVAPAYLIASILSSRPPLEESPSANEVQALVDRFLHHVHNTYISSDFSSDLDSPDKLDAEIGSYLRPFFENWKPTHDKFPPIHPKNETELF